MTAIAVISTSAFATVPKQGQVLALGAVSLRRQNDIYVAALHSHLYSTATAMQRWLDELLSDDPLLVGYRLARMSRLIRASGVDWHLLGSFNRDGRVDLRDSFGSRSDFPALAAGIGMVAVDERSLQLAQRTAVSSTVAPLVLVNAIARTALWAFTDALAQKTSTPLDMVIERLRAATRDGPVPSAVASVLSCSVQ